MAGLPLLLAGPIVRRVDLQSVSVWVACSEAAIVEIHIFDGRQKSTGPGAVESGTAAVAVASVRTTRMGAHLHVAVVVAGDAPPHHLILRPGAVYAYDVVVAPVVADSIGLLDMKLLQDDPGDADDPDTRAIEHVSAGSPYHYALGYEPDYLPSFVTPAGLLEDIRIAQASCRKSHGPGSDALAWLDDVIEDHLDEGDQRIQQLFLTGDQIYADDVPTCLLPLYHELATALMGEGGGTAGEEELPTAAAGVSNVNMQTAPPMRRTVMVRTDGGLSSVESQNHLLTVGEFCAAYLTAWSPRVWRPLPDEDVCYANALANSPFTLTDIYALFSDKDHPGPKNAAAFTAVLKAKYGVKFAEERQRVLVYAATVGKVARVLANTATYMIFDDHDVTDDWNLNRKWRNRVYSRPLGRSVVRNALIVYTFFQAWGSDWPSFTNPTHGNGRLLAAAETYLQTPRGRPVAQRDQLDRLFDFDANQADRAVFHYEAPGLLYQVRVLDSRTRRNYPGERSGAAMLLGDSLDIQLPQHLLRAGNQFLLVIASTPALGPDIFERMITPFAAIAIDGYRQFNREEDTEPQPAGAGVHTSALQLATTRTDGASFVDVETWPANPAAQHQLLSRLSSFGPTVVLGGDVHYGTNLFVDWWEWDRTVGDPSRRSARIVQLTASASRNALETTAETIYRGYHWMNQWVAGSVTTGFGFHDSARPHLHLPPGKRPTINRLHHLHDKPSILLSDGWPAGTTLDTEPDWWFRQQQVRDDRSDTDRTGPFAELLDELEPMFASAMADPAGSGARASKAAAIHAFAAAEAFAPLRDMVMTNNVGLVSFTTDPDGTASVIHDLISTTRQGYPENEPDPDLADQRPLGATASVSTGAVHTRAKISLTGPTAQPVFNERPGHG